MSTLRRSAVLLLGVAALAWLLGNGQAAGSSGYGKPKHRKHDPRVLRVGTYHGIKGQFKTIQAAVNHAKPGDWILIAPGDYKEHGGMAPAGATNTPAGVLITTSGIYIRGMNRNKVVVDGTKPGSPKCSSKASDQEFGPAGQNGAGPLGLNGLMVYKARNVWIQNLTACNYLGGSGDAGNEIWWNGGDGSGQVGGYGYYGSYLTATSQFFQDESTAAQYGIFSSNWSGGTWDHTYASNFNDSGMYIGACQQVCDQTVNHFHSEYNVLGYSGSNSGGQLVVENSEFDNNQDGFDTNSQNGDNPPPQNGACPNNGISPITHTHSCWVFMHNYVHDNNDANVPGAGTAAQGPVGTGMSVSGGRNDTIMDNTFENNNAWGFIFVPYPDSGPPCTGGTQTGAACLYNEFGDALIDNGFAHNGGYGNSTNGDFAETQVEPGATDCFSGNYEIGGGTLTSSPSNLQQTEPTCNGSTNTDANTPFFLQVACDSQASIGPTSGSTACTFGGTYPRRTAVVMHPLPNNLQTMPNPCKGVPRNPWCKGNKHHRKRYH